MPEILRREIMRDADADACVRVLVKSDVAAARALRAAACEPTGLHLQRDTEGSSPTSAMGADQLRAGIAPLALTVFSGAKRIEVRCGGCPKSGTEISATRNLLGFRRVSALIGRGRALVDDPAALASLTKGGLNAATKSLAIEYAKRGIRVNAVALSIIKAPMNPIETHAKLGPSTLARPYGGDLGHRRRNTLPRVGQLRYGRKSLTSTAAKERATDTAPDALSFRLYVRVRIRSTSLRGHRACRGTELDFSSRAFRPFRRGKAKVQREGDGPRG